MAKNIKEPEHSTKIYLSYLNFNAFFFEPKVPCSVAIRSAQAVLEEVPEASSSSIAALGRCDRRNPERAVHRVADRYKLSLPIPMTHVDVGEHRIPVLMMSDWARWILRMNLWYRLCGLSAPDPQRSSAIWTTFWERFRKIQPNHPVFSRDIPLGNICGLLLHGDEGRSQKKSAILCVAAHSALGFGLSTSKADKKAYLAMKLNYEQPTWTTRFLLSVAPKFLYSDDDDDEENTAAFQDLLRHLSKDLRMLWEDGLVGADNERYYFIVIYVMGDWPWHLKAACLGRSFHNAAKRASTTSIPKGICHFCLADLPGHPWEDWQNENPKWMETINTTSPFLRVPAVLEELPHDVSDQPGFFPFDLFHGWHIGAGKSFLSSAIVALASSHLYDGSKEGRLEAVSKDFQDWCRANRHNPTLKRFTLQNVGWVGNSYPSGSWSKGATTTSIMKFFVSKCETHSNELSEDAILPVVYKAASSINRFLSGLYNFEVWIPAADASALADEGFSFLKQFGRVVKISMDLSRLLFIQMPNYHRLHHIFHQMREQARVNDYVLSPLLVATQSDEDFIGRPSRISRRVSARTIVQRTLQRSLLAAYARYVEAGVIVPWPRHERICWNTIKYIT